MGNVVGQYELRSVEVVAQFVTEGRQVGAVLDEAAAVVHDGNAERHAQQNTVQRPVGHHQNAALSFRLGLGFRDDRSRAAGVGRPMDDGAAWAAELGRDQVHKEARRPGRDVVAAFAARRASARGICFPERPQRRILALDLGVAQTLPASVIQLAQPLIELALGLYFTATVFYALANQIYGTLPFLVLFQVGFLYTGLLSVIQQFGGGSSEPVLNMTSPAGVMPWRVRTRVSTRQVYLFASARARQALGSCA